MKKIIAYLIMFFIATIFSLILHHILEMPSWYLENLLVVRCSLIGVVGGILYCIKSIYFHKCSLNDWDDKYQVWYYLRPFSSAISGFVSFIFLKAGLLILEATPETDAISFGYLAIAFIAGYNVDNFMKKIESIANEVWGIKKSNLSGKQKDISENE